MEPWSEVVKAGGNVLLHGVFDGLKTFGHEGCSTELDIGKEGSKEDRLGRASKAVITVCNWERKFHLVFIPNDLAMSLEELGIKMGKMVPYGNIYSVLEWLRDKVGGLVDDGRVRM